MQLTNSLVARLFLLVLTAAPVFAVQASLPSGDLAREVRELEAARLRQVVTGRVCLPNGLPAAGAVVVTSAGGECLTDVDGRFVLAVELPLDDASLEVSALADAATGSGSLVASAHFVPAALSPTAPVGELALTLAPNCRPEWQPTFGGLPGTNEQVRALAVFDDGAGPALFVGGTFTTAGGVAANRIAKWDGSSWSALGSGMSAVTSPAVEALAVYDDGNGPALYAGGTFTTAGGVSANGIARWDGAGWSALGSGASGVHDLTVFDDGSGPALYAGGVFGTAGGVSANGIAKWDGSSWSALDSGTNGYVNAVTAFDDGSGPALYVGGVFTAVGGVPASQIAKWNGSSWSALGTGMGVSSTVYALTVYDDGSGPALYAGGYFPYAGDVAANHVAKWDGSSWSALGSGMSASLGGLPATVNALTVYDDGSGPALYAGGSFTTAGGVPANRIAKWNGSSWSQLDSGTDSGVLALTVFDDGSGPALHAGGSFRLAGGVAASRTAKWNGSSWSRLGSGFNDSVHALTVFDGGSGPALYAGGAFTDTGSVAANRIAKWDGSTWSALGSGTSGGSPSMVLALAAYDDGSGPALYAGGSFTFAGGAGAARVAKWDGSSWSRLGMGIAGGFTKVDALAVYDDGSGPALYAGGDFTTAGGVPASRIAKWNGSSWSALGSGVSGGTAVVTAMAVYDDGSGPALYVGGEFTTAGGVSANHIAKWNGSSWSALGSGANDTVEALAVYDDGGGPALYAGGEFATAGGVAANRIAKWDGASWSALAGGLGGASGTTVYALTVHDDGSGPALLAGGFFGRRVARWDGSSWTTLGIGIDVSVQTLASWNDGDGPALFAGGLFTASPGGDSYLAKLGCRPKPTVKQHKL